jgi:glutathione S-transferase
MTASITLYRFPLSGHSHRAQLLASLLGLDVTLVDVNLPGREQKTPEFLARNPLGQVPVLVDGNDVIADSNAILMYLAAKYSPDRWLPKTPWALAQVVRWFAVTSGPMVQTLAHARAHYLFKRPTDIAATQAGAHDLLRVYEAELEARPFLLGDEVSLADVASYTYVAHAPEGGVSLAAYPRVQSWLAKVEALPGFVAMKKSPLP